MIGEKLEVDRFHESLLPYHNSLSEHLVSIFKLSVGLVFNVAFYALLLFVPASTLHWWRAWVFLAVTLIVTAAAVLSIFPIMPACSRSATEDSSKKDSGCGTEFS